MAMKYMGALQSIYMCTMQCSYHAPLSPHQAPGGPNERLCWDSTSKQAVHFLSPDSALGTSHLHKLNYVSEFNTASGELRFCFTAS